MKHTSLSLRHKQTDTYTSPHMNYDIQMCIHIIHDIFKISRILHDVFTNRMYVIDEVVKVQSTGNVM